MDSISSEAISTSASEEDYSQSTGMEDETTMMSKSTESINEFDS